MKEKAKDQREEFIKRLTEYGLNCYNDSFRVNKSKEWVIELYDAQSEKLEEMVKEYTKLLNQHAELIQKHNSLVRGW